VHEDIGSRSRAGDFLFRWRGHLPFLLVPVMIAAIALSHRPVQSRALDLGWEIGCVLLALVGWSIRVYTVGTAAPGTSGRNTRRQKANFLNITGPYAVVRHPLYLANSLIALAFALFSHTWILPPVMAIAAPLFYGSIARREEEYLRSRFGAQFDAWAARVPAIFPRLGGFVRPERPFDWTAVGRREIYSLTVILVTPLFIDVVEDTWQRGTLTIEPVWLALAVAGAVLFSVGRVLKRRRQGR
jgi:protein-S-isoprenylcysteine O-methyltransferase Ste14